MGTLSMKVLIVLVSVLACAVAQKVVPCSALAILLWFQVEVASELFTEHFDFSDELILQLAAGFVEEDDCEDTNPNLDCGSKSPRALSTLFCLKTFRTSLTFTLIVKYLVYRIDSRLLSPCTLR